MENGVATSKMQEIENSENPPQAPLEIPSLMIGGAVFSYHYNKDITQVPTEAILSRAIDSGANSFDTSPYYGDSETVMGAALQNLRAKHPRNSYILMTKCGRKSLTSFDYSAPWIRQSIQRSLQRLRTQYLDVALLHDAEFTSAAEVIEATSALAQLRAEGLIRAFGISGYNLPILLSFAQAAQAQLGAASAPEVLFSYCHYNLQNNTLADFAPRFREAGIRYIINGSPLSMGLLRAQAAPDWHPASPELRAACVRAAEVVEKRYGQSLADLALKFSLGWEGTTCAGCSTVEELETALVAWSVVERRKESGVGDGEDGEVFARLRGVLAEGKQVTWDVPSAGWVRDHPPRSDGRT